MEGLRGHTSGYAVPTYVIDAPGRRRQDPGHAELPDQLLGPQGRPPQLRGLHHDLRGAADVQAATTRRPARTASTSGRSRASRACSGCSRASGCGSSRRASRRSTPAATPRRTGSRTRRSGCRSGSGRSRARRRAAARARAGRRARRHRAGRDRHERRRRRGRRPRAEEVREHRRASTAPARSRGRATASRPARPTGSCSSRSRIVTARPAQPRRRRATRDVGRHAVNRGREGTAWTSSCSNGSRAGRRPASSTPRPRPGCAPPEAARSQSEPATQPRRHRAANRAPHRSSGPRSRSSRCSRTSAARSCWPPGPCSSSGSSARRPARRAAWLPVAGMAVPAAVFFVLGIVLHGRSSAASRAPPALPSSLSTLFVTAGVQANVAIVGDFGVWVASIAGAVAAPRRDGVSLAPPVGPDRVRAARHGRPPSSARGWKPRRRSSTRTASFGIFGVDRNSALALAVLSAIAWVGDRRRHRHDRARRGPRPIRAAGRRAALTRFWAGVVLVGGVAYSVMRSDYDESVNESVRVIAAVDRRAARPRRRRDPRRAGVPARSGRLRPRRGARRGRRPDRLQRHVRRPDRRHGGRAARRGPPADRDRVRAERLSARVGDGDRRAAAGRRGTSPLAAERGRPRLGGAPLGLASRSSPSVGRQSPPPRARSPCCSCGSAIARRLRRRHRPEVVRDDRGRCRRVARPTTSGVDPLVPDDPALRRQPLDRPDPERRSVGQRELAEDRPGPERLLPDELRPAGVLDRARRRSRRRSRCPRRRGRRAGSSSPGRPA